MERLFSAIVLASDLSLALSMFPSWVQGLAQMLESKEEGSLEA